MIIRPEQPADYEAIAQVVQAAFGRENEARLVELLRAPETYIPELALVAEEDGVVVGHIMTTYVTLEGASTRRVLSLAPLAVVPERQKDGIGGVLMRESIARAAGARGEGVLSHRGGAGDEGGAGMARRRVRRPDRQRDRRAT